MADSGVVTVGGSLPLYQSIDQVTANIAASAASPSTVADPISTVYNSLNRPVFGGGPIMPGGAITNDPLTRFAIIRGGWKPA